MKFKKIYIEITNICNLNCSFCSKSKRVKKEMTIEEFETIINKIKNYTESIYLHIKGEPLTHSKLDQILSLTDKNNIKVNITTNGTLIKEKLDILKNHKINQINISLHCENKKENYFEEIFQSVEELHKKITIVYRMWVLSSIKSKNSKIVEKLNQYYNLNDEKLNEITNNKNIKIKENIYLDKDIEFIWPYIDKSDDTYGTCLGTKTHIGILSDGTVVPCCLDHDGIINLGNILKENLDQILEKKLYKEIKNGFNNHKIIHPLCKNCSFRKRFK